MHKGGRYAWGTPGVSQILQSDEPIYVASSEGCHPSIIERYISVEGDILGSHLDLKIVEQVSSAFDPVHKTLYN